jgi:carbonic anhydrase
MPRTFAPDAVPPDEVLASLREGNRRFVAGQGNAFRRWHPGLVDGQWPVAVVLGCADSRAPAEYVFDQGLGDLFVVRVAGNIVAPSLVGSVEFAASEFGTRLVVVMGHTHCGAVRATLRALARAGGPDSRNLRSIVDCIAPHVGHLVDSNLEGDELMAQAVRANVLAASRELRQSSALIHELADRGRIAIVAAVYDLATGVVTFLD